MSVNHPHSITGVNIVQEKISGKYLHLHIVKDTGEKSDWKNEVAHWFAPINFYVYLWQPVRFRNFFFTRNYYQELEYSFDLYKLLPESLWENKE